MSTSDRLLEISAAFDSYKESGGPPKADPDKYLSVIEHLKSAKHPNKKIPSKPKILTDQPNEEQWDKIMNYYYFVHDRIDKKSPDIEALAELEIWFIKFIEPRPNRSKNMALKMELWKDRELAKYKLMVSDYCPSSYRVEISKTNIEGGALESEWVHNRINQIEELYRNTPQTIIKKNKDTTGVTRSSGVISTKGVVDINKILGRK